MPETKLGLVETFLAQSGIKGMKWGVRRSEGPDGTVSSGLKSKGRSSTASEDAQKASVIAAKAKKSGLSSLSNDEMKTLVTRLNLQQQYSKLTLKPSRLQRVRHFIDGQMKTGRTANDLIAFANSPAGILLMSSMGRSSGKHVKAMASLPGKKRK